MVDIILISVWLSNRRKAKNAFAMGRLEDHARFAKKAKIFGWLEVAWLSVGVIFALVMISGR